MIRRTRIRSFKVTTAALGALALSACTNGADDDRAVDVLPYAAEYPAIGYARTEPTHGLARLAGRLASGPAGLKPDGRRGYLESVLAALEIDPSSQVLVFSRTSLQTRHIHPSTPRAIYFNDDTYVSWVPGASSLELAAFDPALGPVFYQLRQDTAETLSMARELGACLRCHDTYSLSGGGVPRFLLGSGYTGTDGELVSHEAWILTKQATPLTSRWGGWYVTGRHGDQVHLGNIVVERAEDLRDLESLRVGNVDDLRGLLDTSLYLTPYSDIVALLVLEHQIEVQNLISRLRFETVGRRGEDGSDVDAGRLAELVEPLAQAMLMADAAGLTAPVAGASGFRERFEALGPADSSGRGLRELDLESRLFRYPLSYLIYSDAIDALPADVKRALYGRLRAVLESEAGDSFAHLSTADRESIAEILRGTKPEVLAAR